MLILDTIVICRLKINNGISMEFMECLSEDAKKKRDFLYIGDRAAIIAARSHSIPSTRFVDSKMN